MARPLTFVFRVVGLGLTNIMQRKLRSGLTALGVVFGVGSVISMLAIGEGASREAQAQIRRLGSNNIIVRNVKPPTDPNNSSSKRDSRFLDYGLRYADAEKLAETITWAEVVVPVKSRQATVRHRELQAQANILGVTPWYPRSMPLRVSRGRFFTDLDMTTMANVCVIGSRLARELFLFRDPIDQSIAVGNNAYRVVGVVDLAAPVRGDKSDNLPTQSVDVFVPLATMRGYEGDLFFQVQSGGSQSEYVELSELILTVKDQEKIIPTSEVIQRTLEQTHPEKDYEMIVPLQLLIEARRTQAIFSIVLGSIAAISLLVGGIGIMNIMLASVSERTREIGIRRALGARRSDIMLQFLVECLMLSLGGGLIGMALGAAIPWFVSRFSHLTTALTPFSFMLAFGVSLGTGLIFGLYPARRAAIMDPIDALRYE